MKLVWQNGKLVDTELGSGLVGTVFQQSATETPNTSIIGLGNLNGSIDTSAYKLNNIGTATPNTGFNLSTLGNLSNAATGLGGLYLGYKQLGLAEDKFAYDKEMMDKQYAMAKDAYDKQVARAKNIGDQMNAGKVV